MRRSAAGRLFLPCITASSRQRQHPAVGNGCAREWQVSRLRLAGERRLFVRDRIVSASFRQEIGATWPGVENDPARWRMLGYLLFGGFRDEDTDGLLISQTMLADLEGKRDELLNRNYSGRKFLDCFSENVAPLGYSDWDYEAGKCRVVTHFDIPEAIREATAREREQRGKIAPRVYLSNGIAANPRNRGKKLAEEREAAKELIGRAQGRDAPRLLDYLNHLPPHRFTETVMANMEAARRVADALPTEKRHHAHTMLDAIQDQPVPFYAPSLRGRTVRIFPCNQSLLLLNSTVRRALTQEWIEIDLAASQLAIVATTWDIPSVRDFLKTKRSIWDYLFGCLDITKSDENKGILKQAMYACIFGMQVQNVTRRLDRMFGVAGIGARFTQLPLIRDLLEAREKQIALIKQRQGASNVYGTWLPLAEPQAQQKRSKLQEAQSARSILACCAQAMEMSLLSPVIDAAIENKNKVRGFTITLWQHDGCSFVPHCKSDTSKWTALLQRLVQERADRADILTRLEVKQ